MNQIIQTQIDNFKNFKSDGIILSNLNIDDTTLIFEYMKNIKCTGQYLSLTCNNLYKLSKNIKYLINLIGLYLDKNKINILPKEIKYLNLLQDLNISHNQLTILPKEIRFLHLCTFKTPI
jgi:Leucine-rich repeat (LRR) protein